MLHLARILVTQFSFQFAIMNLSAGFSELCRVLRYLGSLSGKLEENVKANKLLRLVVARKKWKLSFQFGIHNQLGRLFCNHHFFSLFRRTTGGKLVHSGQLSSTEALLLILTWPCIGWHPSSTAPAATANALPQSCSQWKHPPTPHHQLNPLICSTPPPHLHLSSSQAAAHQKQAPQSPH